jgi:hypothetical protein
MIFDELSGKAEPFRSSGGGAAWPALLGNHFALTYSEPLGLAYPETTSL